MNRREALKKTVFFAGIAVSGSTAFTLLQGCQSKYNQKWEPAYFTKEEFILVSSICDVVLPKTNTPGALQLHLPEFLDVMLNDCIPDADKIFRKTLKDFSESMVNQYSKPFEKCNSRQQLEIISGLEEKSNPETDKDQKYLFYTVLKDITRFGYLTSEYVMKNLLDYQPIPVDFKGCIDADSETIMSVTN
jgi:hypothetical protein